VKKKFKWAKGLKKGLVAAASVGAGLVAGAEALGSLDAVQELSAVTAIGAAVAAIRVGMNWWKVNRDLADKTYIR
jgi:hypothetical protein